VKSTMIPCSPEYAPRSHYRENNLSAVARHRLRPVVFLCNRALHVTERVSICRHSLAKMSYFSSSPSFPGNQVYPHHSPKHVTDDDEDEETSRDAPSSVHAGVRDWAMQRCGSLPRTSLSPSLFLSTNIGALFVRERRLRTRCVRRKFGCSARVRSPEPESRSVPN
jgi:hypothetical protein